MVLKNYYYILGVSKTASQKEIKDAYRKLSVKFHPDKNEGDSFMSEMFKNINEAYTILSDSEKKSKFDYDLDEQEKEAGKNYISQDELIQLNKLSENYFNKTKIVEEKKKTYQSSLNANKKDEFRFKKIIIPFIVVLFSYFVFPPNTSLPSDNMPEMETFTWITLDKTPVYQTSTISSKTIAFLGSNYRIRSKKQMGNFVEINFINRFNYLTKGYVSLDDLIKKDMKEALLMSVVHPKLIIGNQEKADLIKKIILEDNKNYTITDDHYFYMVSSVKKDHYYKYSIEKQLIDEYGYRVDLNIKAVERKINSLGFVKNEEGIFMSKNNFFPCIEVHLYKINKRSTSVLYCYKCKEE